MDQRSAIAKINKSGILLVFPINNKKQPDSLWTQFFPRSKMRWEWDASGDNRVPDLWHLMKRLSDCKQVVYSKWYQGRATFFSKELFTALLARTFKQSSPLKSLSATARQILDVLEMDSPLSTKELKAATDLQGKFNEPNYNRAMKELFSRFLIVGFGEVDDGAFPSLAVGSTRALYEELYESANKMELTLANAIIEKYMSKGSAVRKFLERQESKMKIGVLSEISI
jgi:hypothetical protein